MKLVFSLCRPSLPSLLLLLTTAAACHDPPPERPRVKLNEHDHDSARLMLAAARRRITLAEKKRDAAFARAGSTLRVTAQPCPVGRKELGIPDDIGPNARTTKLLGMTRVITPDARSEAPAGVASQRLETETFLIKRKLDEELGYGQTGESFLADEQRTLDAVQVPPYELALVLERFADPKQIDDQAFRGGFTDGKLYLYSEAAGAILCAADVADESSAEVSVTVHSFGGAPSQEDVHGAMSAHLTGELIVRTIDRGLSALHAVETVAVPVEPRHRKAR